jgi:hypothetical protein
MEKYSFVNTDAFKTFSNFQINSKRQLIFNKYMEIRYYYYSINYNISLYLLSL